MIEEYINNLKSEIISKTQEMIMIPSISIESKNPQFPFGKEASNALNYILDLGKKLGFRTKNIDNYCGYIEFGEGKEMLGIIGHLDVVPEGDNWEFPPYEAKISDGKIYGRGAIDDKGPVIASLYAMKSVMDNYKLNKRVRLIIGLNEEKGWKCIEYYKEHEEYPTIGFSPDADFPCIYAEKGIMNTYISCDYSKFINEPIIIESIDCNNNAINVVPKFCSALLLIDTNKIKMSDLICLLNKIINKNDFEIDVCKINDKELKLISHGIQAHAAHPDLGINSISRLLIVLNEMFLNYNINVGLIKFFCKYILLQYNGENLNISCEDESGKLTLNVGNVFLEKNDLKIGLNLRVPVHTKLDDIKIKLVNITNKQKDVKCYFERFQEPLYLPKDNYLVKTLCKIYNEMTNSNLEPVAIGGGTYARAFKNCISFGANLPNQKDMCHQTDEFISIDNLILTCKIYAKAIYELGI